MTHARRRLLLALVAAPLASQLAACGFHLRGNKPMPFKTLAVEGKSGPFMDLLKRQLQAMGVNLAAPDKAEAVLTVLDDGTTQTAMAYNSDGTVSMYLLGVDLRYQLALPNGDLLIPPTPLHQTSYLSYATSATLAKADEADLLYRGMRDNLLMRVLTQLAAQHPPAAAHP